MPVLTPMQVAAAAYLGGWRGDDLRTAVAVAKGESGHNPDAGGNSACRCIGLFQVNLDAHKQYKEADMRHPVKNAEAAHKIWSSQGGWCRTKNPPNCQPYQAYKRDTPGDPWSAKVEQGKRAVENFYQNVHSRQIKHRLTPGGQFFGIKTVGDCARDILAEAGYPNAGGGDRSLNDPPDLPGNLDAIFRFPNLEGFFKALTSKNTWQRVAQVVLGALLVGVGVVALTNMSGKLPAGQLAKALK